MKGKSLSFFICLAVYFNIVISAPVRHGTERIVVKNNKDDQVQFKSIKTNESESMFEPVKSENMNLTM